MTTTTIPGRKYLAELSWEDKARENPLYGVMSVGEFASAGAEPTAEQLERFFGEGRVKADAWLLPWLAATGARRDATILEFGCGMGRLVRAVHATYAGVIGVDISPTMVDRARTYVPGPSFRTLGEDGSIPLPPDSVDRAYSYAVFQHISRWSVIRHAIAEIGRVLRTGGRAKLQFDMAFAPDFSGRSLRRRTFAFERRSLVHGWSRRFGVPVPGIRFLEHDHWRGARPGYAQLLGCLRRVGLEVNGVECLVETPHLVWLTAHKTGVSAARSC